MRWLFVLMIGGLAHAAEARTCIENSDAEPLYLTVDTGNTRVAGWVDPGGMLCATADRAGRATVAAFTGPDVLEGCSRRVPAGVTERIMAYLGVDNCRWTRSGP